MASSENKISKIGIICEESTDFEALKVLILKVINTKKVGFKSKIGNGCTKIRSKCVPWAQDLKNRKCDLLIVVHDLDRKNYKELYEEIDKKLSNSTFARYILSIPVEELEAWIIADPSGIKTALKLKRLPKFKGLPETVASPKEKLRDSIFQCSGKEINYQTSMNARITQSVDIEQLLQKCPSFEKFYNQLKNQEYI